MSRTTAPSQTKTAQREKDLLEELGAWREAHNLDPADFGDNRWGKSLQETARFRAIRLMDRNKSLYPDIR